MKYYLEPYKGKKTRHACPNPNCKGKHSFSLYIDQQGNYLAENVGRCNHETSCGHHYTPREYFADNPTATSSSASQGRAKPKPKPKPKPIEYIDKGLFLRTLSEHRSLKQNSLFRWLSLELGEQKAVEVAKMYHLGTSEKGEAIFWQVDQWGQVRTGKIRKYNSKTGKSLTIDWVHSRQEKETGKTLNYAQVYFGSHLLTLEENKGKTVAIVEGEKTAIFMAALMPQYVWVATGGGTNFGIECKVNFSHLAGFTAIVFPDVGKYADWSDKAERARHKGYNIAVSNLLESKAAAIGENADLIDLYLYDKANKQAQHPTTATSSSASQGRAKPISTNRSDISNDKAETSPVTLSEHTSDLQGLKSFFRAFHEEHKGSYPKAVVLLDKGEILSDVLSSIRQGFSDKDISLLESIKNALRCHEIAESLT